MHLTNVNFYSTKNKEIENIKEIVELGQFRFAIKKIQQFFNQYGKDCEILYIYGKLLRKTGNITESINILLELTSYLENSRKTSFLFAAYTELFKVYFINDYYDNAYKLLLEGKVDLTKASEFSDSIPDIEVFKKILEIRLGIYHGSGEESKEVKKALNYNRHVALNHCKKHLYHEDGLHIHSVFNDIDIDSLFKQVEKIIPKSKKMQRFSINDTYIFNFSRIGENDFNNLFVVTNKGTNEIVSLYPTKLSFKGEINNNLYEDYLEKNYTKVKTISQIDKFNNRYNKK